MVNKMKKIGLIPNSIKDPDFSRSRAVCEYLHKVGAQIYTDDQYRDLVPPYVEVLPAENIFSVCECVIALGGDGTLLQIAQPACLANIPILGINYGKIGYMAELEYNEIDQLKCLIDNEFSTENRSMLDVSVLRGDTEIFSSIALNDAVISSGAITRLIDMQVTANNQNISTYSADGLIVSTPTGSTGYSLSAGGPVLEPTGNALILTPICPHTLGARPIVFAADSCIRVTLVHLVNKDAHLTVDGYQRLPLADGDVVQIRRSSYVTQLIKIKNLNFYQILNHKLANGDINK